MRLGLDDTRAPAHRELAWRELVDMGVERVATVPVEIRELDRSQDERDLDSRPTAPLCTRCIVPQGNHVLGMEGM